MSMMWIRKQSKYLIVGAALLVGGGLIMMDLPSANGRTASPTVGEVNGTKISIEAYQQSLQNYLQGEEARNGRPLEGAELGQAYQYVFQMQVQSMLLEQLIKDYRLNGSVQEMQAYLLRNPQAVAMTLAQTEGPERVPYFLADSVINPAQYQAWLFQDSVYDRPGMRYLERNLKTNVMPMLQLRQIFVSQIHRTDLEESFRIEAREARARLQYYRVPQEAFAVDPASLSDADVKAHFEANPDSFWQASDAARLSYVRIPIAPSAADTALMRDFAAELRQRLTSGENFEELARSYSNDAGSAENGGRLQPSARAAWVPEFADAAFALPDSGVSAPVLTPYGYHLIKSHGKKMIDGELKADVSHILLKITAGSETVDAAQELAEKVRKDAEDDGFEAAAKKAGLTVEKTPVFAKASASPLGTTHVMGLSSYAFSPSQRKAKVSEVLQNDQAVWLFAHDAFYKKGRDFDRSRDAVRLSLARSRQLEAARKEAERVRPEILRATAPLPATIGKAVLDTTGLISGVEYAPGFGFESPALLKAVRMTPGAWSPVLPTTEGAVVARVTQQQPVDPAVKNAMLNASRAAGDDMIIDYLYERWALSLPHLAKVKNTLNQSFPY